MVIIDSQVHVWTAETPDRPWRSPTTHMPNPFRYDDLLKVMDGAGVGGAVLVPPGWEGGRPDHALEGAARHPDRFRVMGRVTLDDPGEAAKFASWRSAPGMVGIRVAFQRENTRKMLAEGAADWLWPAAEAHRLPIMLFAPGQVQKVIDIARNHPRLALIFDHMGLYRETDADAAATIESILPLADCPNVHVKVTSVPFYSTEPYPYRGLHGALARLIGAFGPERAFWGTDITRLWERASYRQCVTLFTEELDFLSGEDLEWVMGRGVARCLGWKLAA